MTARSEDKGQKCAAQALSHTLDAFSMSVVASLLLPFLVLLLAILSKHLWCGGSQRAGEHPGRVQRPARQPGADDARPGEL